MTKEEFIAQLSHFSGKEIYWAQEDLDFMIWDSSEIAYKNKVYEVEESLPGHIAFGTNGGGEMLCVELSSGICYAVPFIGLAIEDRMIVARSVNQLKSII